MCADFLIQLYMAYCVAAGLMDATVKSAAWKTICSTSTSMYISISGGINNYYFGVFLWGILGYLEGGKVYLWVYKILTNN